MPSAEAHGVEQKQRQSRQQQPPYGGQGRKQHRRRSQYQRHGPEAQGAGAAHAGHAPQAADHAQQAQYRRQAYAAILLRQKAGVIAGMELLPRLHRRVQQLGKTVGHSTRQCQHRQQAARHPCCVRQPREARAFRQTHGGRR